MITPINDVTNEYTIPVKVLISYTDDLGEEKTETQSVPLLLRPKCSWRLLMIGEYG